MTDAESGGRVIAALAEVGPFFEVELVSRHGPLTRPWRPILDLTADPVLLADRVQRVRHALAAAHGVDAHAVDARVAASTVQFGLVARIVAVAIGYASLNDGAIDLDPQDVWWCDRQDGLLALAARATSHRFGGRLDGTAVEAVTSTVADRFAVAPRVLWGNVGSAANSAAKLIAAARPDAAGRAHELADAVLADPRVDDGLLHAGTDFRRRSCCLIYRAGGGTAAMCGDCVLRRAR